MIQLSPYLNFNATCKAAMEFYKECLGGTLTMQTFGQAQMGADEAFKDQIMHATLTGEGFSFMASDAGHIGTVTMGSSMHMSLAGDEMEKMRTWFTALSAGGVVDMPLQKQFWGDTFGMLTDKFGIHWMFNISEPKK